MNMFSENGYKKIPKSLKDCYRNDSITYNLWNWCERLEKWGQILFWILIVIGIIDTIVSGVNAHLLISQIGAETIEEIREASAQLGIEIPTVFEAVIHNLLSWAFYALLEYCAYHIVALLIASLASIVQHTKITANIALYNAAKEEGISDETVKANTDDNEDNDEPIIFTSAKEMPRRPKKEKFYKNQFDLDDDGNPCAIKCDMCGCEGEKITPAKITDDFGTRYRNLCDKCMEQYNAEPV